MRDEMMSDEYREGRADARQAQADKRADSRARKMRNIVVGQSSDGKERRRGQAQMMRLLVLVLVVTIVLAVTLLVVVERVDTNTDQLRQLEGQNNTLLLRLHEGAKP